jgi:hypothetical protein
VLRGMNDRADPKWELAVSPVGVIAAGFTTLCCLGIAAALSFASSIGATFLTRDSSLRPILFVTLAVTTAGSALTYWRHRQTVVPLAVTVAASVWIYLAVFASVGHDAMHDNMADAHVVAVHHHSLSGGRQALAGIGLAVLIGAQLWDLLRVRTQRQLQATPVAKVS